MMEGMGGMMWAAGLLWLLLMIVLVLAAARAGANHFRALRGARVLGNGGPLCGGVAARPNPARTDGRIQVISFSLGRLSDYLEVSCLTCASTAMSG
jgi:hypothetical protein